VGLGTPHGGVGDGEKVARCSFHKVNELETSPRQPEGCGSARGCYVFRYGPYGNKAGAMKQNRLHRDKQQRVVEKWVKIRPLTTLRGVE